MSSEKSKPTNHGTIQPTAAPLPAAPRIPRSLRKIGIIEMPGGSMNHARSVERYGLWRVRALQNCMAFGKLLLPGDTAELAGNVALTLVQTRKAEFLDPRLDDEDRVAAEVARLNVAVPARDNPAFARR